MNIGKKHYNCHHFCPIHRVIVICLAQKHSHILKNPPEHIFAKYLFLKNLNVSSMLFSLVILQPVPICIYPHWSLLLHLLWWTKIIIKNIIQTIHLVSFSFLLPSSAGLLTLTSKFKCTFYGLLLWEQGCYWQHSKVFNVCLGIKITIVEGAYKENGFTKC